MEEFQNEGPFMDELDTNVGGIVDTGVDYAAIELLINFVNFLWDLQYVPVMRLNGGGIKRVAQAITDTVGLKGFDWMARHFMTKRYREAVQQAQDAETRKRVRDWQAGSYAAERIKRRSRYPARTDNIPNNSMPVGRGMFFGPETVQRYNNRIRTAAEWDRMKKKAYMIGKTVRTLASMEVYYTIHKYACIPFFNVVSVGPTPNYYWKTGIGHMNGLWSRRSSTVGTGTLGTSGWAPSLRYFEIETPNDSGGPFSSVNQASMPNNANILVFTADWPFAQMTPLKTDNVSDDVSLMVWKDVSTDFSQTTDPIYPVQFQQVAANKDWQTIYHLGTQLTMDFVNYSPDDMNIEVLLFKWIVDPDTMDTYQKWATVGMSGYRDWNEYLDGEKFIGTPQIRVVRKSRFMLKGSSDMNIAKMSADTNLEDCQVITATGEMKSCRRKKVYNITRKYAMKRPVETIDFATSFSERGMYQELYNLEDGVFCRVMAWPAKVRYDISVKDYLKQSPTVRTEWNNIYNGAAGLPSVLTKNGYPRACVGCQIIKKSYIKLDKPMLRGPFLTANS